MNGHGEIYKKELEEGGEEKRREDEKIKIKIIFENVS